MAMRLQEKQHKRERRNASRPLTLDFRSDTVTKPTAEMRRAMAEAEVGDDVYGEDPTVNKLEQRAAEIFGREAALFVPSGTMGNQIAIKCHTRPGQEVICEELAHCFNFEMAMLAHFSGCVARTVKGEDGILSWSQIKKKIAQRIYYLAQTGLITIENTHNFGGGTVYPEDVAAEICDGAHALGIPVHLDGARIFNAGAASGKPVKELTQKFDSIMFCLSKGLGAPVGSMLIGSQKLIEQGRAYRKALGGGMRQAGILAAAGLIALEKGPARLREDHANARWLAERVAQVSGIKLDPEKVRTNILVFDILGTGMNTSELTRKAAEHNLLVSSVNERLLKMVTHMDVQRSDCEQAIEILRRVCGTA
jgi:threonine aldolase